MSDDVQPISFVPVPPPIRLSAPVEDPQRYRWDTVQLDEFGWFCHLTADPAGPLYAARDANGFLHIWPVNGAMLSA